MEDVIKITFERVIAENKHKILRICQVYALKPIEPEDLFQEVVFSIWKAFPTFKNESQISTWVYRIALNICMRYNARLKNRNGKMIQLDSIRFEPPEELPDEKLQERYTALHDCIRSMQEKDSSIAIMVLDGLPYKEIANITGLKENHIAVKMKRMKKVLLNCINNKLL